MKVTPATEATIPEIVQARREISTKEIVEYRADGFLHLRRLLSPETAIVLCDEVLSIMEVVGLGRTKLRQTHQYLHGSGPNNTHEHRVAYAVQFHSDDAVAEIHGEQHLLTEKLRFRDILGCAGNKSGPRGKARWALR